MNEYHYKPSLPSGSLIWIGYGEQTLYIVEKDYNIHNRLDMLYDRKSLQYLKYYKALRTNTFDVCSQN